MERLLSVTAPPTQAIPPFGIKHDLADNLNNPQPGSLADAVKNGQRVGFKYPEGFYPSTSFHTSDDRVAAASLELIGFSAGAQADNIWDLLPSDNDAEAAERYLGIGEALRRLGEIPSDASLYLTPREQAMWPGVLYHALHNQFGVPGILFGLREKQNHRLVAYSVLSQSVDFYGHCALERCLFGRGMFLNGMVTSEGVAGKGLGASLVAGRLALAAHPDPKNNMIVIGSVRSTNVLSAKASCAAGEVLEYAATGWEPGRTRAVITNFDRHFYGSEPSDARLIYSIDPGMYIRDVDTKYSQKDVVGDIDSVRGKIRKHSATLAVPVQHSPDPDPELDAIVELLLNRADYVGVAYDGSPHGGGTKIIFRELGTIPPDTARRIVVARTMVLEALKEDRTPMELRAKERPGSYL